MITTDYKPTKPLYCGRLAGKLGSSVYAGELTLEEIETAIYASLQEDEAELIYEDIRWIWERVAQTAREVEAE